MLGGFIGVDFSGGEVRTVTIKRGLKGTEILKSSFPGELGNSNTAGFLQGEISLGTQAIAGISFSPLLLRVLRFPFSDSKKLRRVYRFELENSTGFTLGEDVLSDYHEVKRPEGAEIIVPAFKKEVFENYLGSLKESGVDPDKVTFSPVAVSSLEKFLGERRPLLLIDIDQDHLNFSFFDKGGLRRVRNCDDALERMKRVLAVSALDFRQINGDEGRKKAFFESCRFIADEVETTARYFESETGEGIKSLVLTGGICKVEGIVGKTRRAARPGSGNYFYTGAWPEGLSLFCQGVRLGALRRFFSGGRKTQLEKRRVLQVARSKEGTAKTVQSSHCFVCGPASDSGFRACNGSRLRKEQDKFHTLRDGNGSEEGVS